MKFYYTFTFLVMFCALHLNASPCDDKNYVELKEKMISEMSEREYTYFLEKDKACNKTVEGKGIPLEYSSQFDNESAPKAQSSPVRVWEIALLLYAGAAVVSTLVLISIIN